MLLLKVKNPQIFFFFFDILEKTFIPIDLCNMVTRLVFLQISPLKWLKKPLFVFDVMGK